MAKVIKYLCLVIWVGIVGCASLKKEKTETEENKNTFTISIYHRDYSSFDPYKISTGTDINNFQELYNTMPDFLKQLEECLNSIRIRAQNSNLPFNYFSTFPSHTIPSNPNFDFNSIFYNSLRNQFLDTPAVASKRPFHINQNKNFLPIPDNTQQNQIPHVVPTKPFNSNAYNNFHRYSPPENPIFRVSTTTKPFNSNAYNNFHHYSPPENPIFRVSTTTKPFNSNTYNNFHRYSPPENPIFKVSTTTKPFNINSYNFKSYSPPQNSFSYLPTTKRPVTTTEESEVIATIPIENTTPFIEETNTVLPEETTTEQNFEDNDETTRPITFYDIKSDKFNKRLFRSGSRRLPEVEHGSVQAGS